MVICEYCGDETEDENGVASDDYMYHGHLLFDCSEVPALVRARLNAPPEERYA